MVSKSVAFLLADLGVTKTHSRPHVSNDNPFSEAQFKTLKYRPAFPERFGSLPDARAHGHIFFPWYNTEHHHSGLGLLTPHDVHFGLAEQRVAERAAVLTAAYAAHPERFPAGRPTPAPALDRGLDQSPQAARARGGGAHSLNSITDCLIPIDRLRTVRRKALEKLLFRQTLILPARRLRRNGLAAWAQVLTRGWEGSVAKDPTSPYVGGRTLKWLKVKQRDYRVKERGFYKP
jgi:hypothetical protein